MSYKGNARTRVVTHDGKPIPLRLEVANHSPDGFMWGYAGSGPAQLALAILLDHTGATTLSNRLYQDFKADVIARLPMDEDFEIQDDEVRRWLEDRRKGHMSWGPGDVEFVAPGDRT